MRPVNVRLDDEHSEKLDRLTATGRSTSDVMRTALALYHDVCKQGADLEHAGYANGLIRIRVDHSAEGARLALLIPTPGQRA
ncbi:ribbon-helix-helix protein, CopG family [Streptomyces sp. NPDC007206]|uniref:ribbon-helix-helix protein, CopG family n=1 Tax=Streptomyces sp. NPDC007206 TaxID=3154317 RepID=UPI0033F63FD1